MLLTAKLLAGVVILFALLMATSILHEARTFYNYDTRPYRVIKYMRGFFEWACFVASFSWVVFAATYFILYGEF